MNLRLLGGIAALLLWLRPVGAQTNGAAGAAGAAGAVPSTPFQVGDRILLSVEGDSALTDTFTVVAGPVLRLPQIGDISLASVPRSGIEPYLTRELGRYINDPVVSARALIRISVMGEVARPGFYAVPIDLGLRSWWPGARRRMPALKSWKSCAGTRVCGGVRRCRPKLPAAPHSINSGSGRATVSWCRAAAILNRNGASGQCFSAVWLRRLASSR
jgi:hypothetical protein